MVLTMRKTEKIARLQKYIDSNTEKAMKLFRLNKKYNKMIDKLEKRNTQSSKNKNEG